MSGAGKMTSETKTREGTGAFMGNLIPILTLLVIGYPLAPSPIRAMLAGWILIGGAVTRSILGRHFQIQTTGSIRRDHKDSARTLGRMRALSVEVDTQEC